MQEGDCWGWLFWGSLFAWHLGSRKLAAIPERVDRLYD
jgi:hypothetical protein